MRTAIPSGVNQAIIAIWATLGISALLALYNKVTGAYDNGQFLGELFIYALMCIIPYKLSNGSNATRYVYAVLTAFMILLMFAFPSSLAETPKITLVVSAILTPVEVFIFYRLFQAEASAWFRGEY